MTASATNVETLAVNDDRLNNCLLEKTLLIPAVNTCMYTAYIPECTLYLRTKLYLP